MRRVCQDVANHRFVLSSDGSVTLYTLRSGVGGGLFRKYGRLRPALTMLNADRIANFLPCGPSKNCVLYRTLTLLA